MVANPSKICVSVATPMTMGLAPAIAVNKTIRTGTTIAKIRVFMISSFLKFEFQLNNLAFPFKHHQDHLL
jgi:hypothetical protein